jgi:hypothetical protein
MENEEKKCEKNEILKQIKPFKKHKKEENITLNINLSHKKKNYKLRAEFVSLKHNNTICYSKLKYFNKKLKKSKKIGKNRTEIFLDKIIQTPASFYNNTFINKSHFGQNLNIKSNIKKSISQKEIFLKNMNKRKNSSIINLPINFDKLAINNHLKRRNQKLTRNKLNPLFNFEMRKKANLKNQNVI